MPDGPAAAPRLADLRLRHSGEHVRCDSVRQWLPSTRRSPVCVSLKASKVAWFLGANAAPSSACRADECSPNDTNISALAARLSRSSCARLFDLLREMAGLSSHCSLATIKSTQSPRENDSNLALSLDFETLLPPGGRCNNILGNMRRSFHPRSCSTSPAPSMISFNATFSAFLKRPWKFWAHF